jgi:hypothetical protein
MPIVPICPEDEDAAPESDSATRNSQEISRDQPKNSYEVGYCRPPKHTQFRKGQSGNPKGRPKFAKGLNTIIREEMFARVAVRTSGGERYIPRAQALVLKLLELGAKGDLRALRLLLDLYAGAVPDTSATSDAETFDFTEADQEILELLKARLVGVTK